VDGWTQIGVKAAGDGKKDNGAEKNLQSVVNPANLRDA
jgi:hypothetical protein